jgi:hypothetical protein
MEMDPNPPSFNIPYSVQPMNIGEGYAAGITQAGKSLSAATAGVMDVMTRNQNANDILTALKQTGVLTPDQYNAVATKSLGAKESLTGMYANQWVLDQAARREQSLAAGKGGVDVAVEHAKWLDVLNAYKSGAPGLDQSKMPWQPPVQPNQQPNPPAPVLPSQPAILAAQQQGGQYAGGPQVQGARPSPRIGPLPGSKRIQRTDPTTGKTQIGWQYPGGAFVADQGQ